jgi:hypothetical protein
MSTRKSCNSFTVLNVAMALDIPYYWQNRIALSNLTIADIGDRPLAVES